MCFKRKKKQVKQKPTICKLVKSIFHIPKPTKEFINSGLQSPRPNKRKLNK
jgi:hypothetical protein